MELQNSKPLTEYEVWVDKFKRFWDTDKPDKLISKYRFFYEEGINIINVYQQTKKTKVAYFTRERAWIDNKMLFSLLFDEFKEYGEYFKGRKGLLK